MMSHNSQLEAYIHEHLEDQSVFYVIDQKFWLEWTRSIGFFKNSSFVKKAETMRINNESLIEAKHEIRMKDLAVNEDFVLVPKCVFEPL